MFTMRQDNHSDVNKDEAADVDALFVTKIVC